MPHMIRLLFQLLIQLLRNRNRWRLDRLLLCLRPHKTLERAGAIKSGTQGTAEGARSLAGG